MFHPNGLLGRGAKGLEGPSNFCRFVGCYSIGKTSNFGLSRSFRNVKPLSEKSH